MRVAAAFATVTSRLNSKGRSVVVRIPQNLVSAPYQTIVEIRMEHYARYLRRKGSKTFIYKITFINYTIEKTILFVKNAFLRVMKIFPV